MNDKTTNILKTKLSDMIMKIDSLDTNTLSEVEVTLLQEKKTFIRNLSIALTNQLFNKSTNFKNLISKWLFSQDSNDAIEISNFALSLNKIVASKEVEKEILDKKTVIAESV